MKKILLLASSVVLLSPSLCMAEITPKNDSLFLKQKPLFEQMNVFEAWETTKGSPEVIIGCIDNGFDFYHPYLHDQLIPGYYADKAYHTETFQNIAHGTLISSLMVANPQNENGMHGLAPGCKVLTASLGVIEHPFVRFFNEIKKNNPGMSTADAIKKMQEEMMKDTLASQQFGVRWRDYVNRTVANSIVYLVDNGVKVINMSLFLLLPELQELNEISNAFEYARKHDVLLTLGAGNHNVEIPYVFKNRDHIIVVGALDKNDKRWTMTTKGITQGSCWGEVLDVCAPIENIVFGIPSDPRFYKAIDSPMGPEDTTYEGICEVTRYGATSCATALVTSLAALVYSVAPDMTASEVKQAILDGCDDVGDPGVDIYTGHGRINYGKTISLVMNRKAE